jgi:hypothetical protein
MTFFNTYINDLPAELKTDRNIKCAMFADDVAIWTTVKNSVKNHREQLQKTMDNTINRLCTWSQKTNMEIIMPETFYQYFSLRHKSETFNITINNSQITKTNCTKYLGVPVDNKLNWEQHVIKTEEKVNTNLHIPKRLAGKNGGAQWTL